MLLSKTLCGNIDNYTNDANGNTLTGGDRTNTWDSSNRLITCATNAHSSSYVYGADGLRRQSTVDGTTTDFVLDGQSVVREMHGTAACATYLQGPMGPLYRRDDATQTVSWDVYDGLGSVVAEVDPTGNVTSTRKYDVYGAARWTTGTASTRHGFVGALGHTEDETGLEYMRAREYDPGLGRFISEDPAGSGGNWLAYCNGNPVMKVDATGRNPILIAGVVIAAIAGGLVAGFSGGSFSWARFWGGAAVAAATTVAGIFGGWIGGAVVGAISGMIDAYFNNGSVATAGLLGGLFGGLGGAVGAPAWGALGKAAAEAETNYAIMFLLATGDSGLCGGVDSEAAEIKW